MTTIYTPLEWIMSIIVCVLGFLATLIIMKNEIKKRRNSNIVFTTEWLRILSIASMTCFFFALLFHSLFPIPVICTFSSFLALVLFTMGGFMMGFYQLSRLYYIFANTQIYSNKGYPRRIFVFMVIVGIILEVCLVAIGIINDNDSDTPSALLTSCTFNSNFERISEPLEVSIINGIKVSFAYIGILYSIWDLSTLFMYFYKIKTFTNSSKNPIIYKRVMNILYKVAILTLFYEMIFLMAIITLILLYKLSNLHQGIISVYGINIISVSHSFAMYLMMDHNKDEYVKFLRWIHCLRLNWICCCWGNMITDQLLELTNTGPDTNGNPEPAVSIYEDRDLSVNDNGAMPQARKMMSVEITMTHV